MKIDAKDETRNSAQGVGPRDRRGHGRVRVNATCRVHGAAAASVWRVRDISRTGLLLCAAVARGTPFEHVGQALTVDLELPQNPALAPRCLRCRGTVVRICETGEGVRELAVSVAHMDFCDAAQSPAAEDLPFK